MKTKTDFRCTYCHLSIDTECFGWGYLILEDMVVRFHNECFEICEGVPV